MKFNNNELKNCPFCGSEATFYLEYERNGYPCYLYIECNGCGCSSCGITEALYPEDGEGMQNAQNKLINIWNRRV